MLLGQIDFLEKSFLQITTAPVSIHISASGSDALPVTDGNTWDRRRYAASLDGSLQLHKFIPHNRKYIFIFLWINQSYSGKPAECRKHGIFLTKIKTGKA